jgi:hypothetical protein
VRLALLRLLLPRRVEDKLFLNRQQTFFDCVYAAVGFLVEVRDIRLQPCETQFAAFFERVEGAENFGLPVAYEFLVACFVLVLRLQDVLFDFVSELAKVFAHDGSFFLI